MIKAIHKYDEDGVHFLTVFGDPQLYAAEGNWTLTPLLPTEAYECNRMRQDGQWEIVPDYRGVVLHDPDTRKPFVLDRAGVTPPAGSVIGYASDSPGTPDDHSYKRADLIARLAALRYRVETGGTSLGGVRILTGRTDQAMTTQAFVTLQSGMVDGIDWKGPDGWQRVTLAELEPVARAVAAHVQRCFTTERIVSEQIAAADPQTFDVQAAWAMAWGDV